MVRRKIIFIWCLLIGISAFSQDSAVFTYDQFMSYVRNYHPVIVQTDLRVAQAENATMLNDFLPEPKTTYALVFGNEVKGVKQEVVSASDLVLEIPQFGTKHSLNISVSVGVVIWDVFSKMKGQFI